MKEVSRGVFFATLLVVFSVFFPLPGLLTAFFVPLPALYYRYKLGRGPGILVIGTCLVLTALATGLELWSLVFWGGLLLLGFWMGEGLAAGRQVEATIGLPALGVFGLSALVVFAAASAAGQNVADLVKATIDKNFEMTLALYEALGISGSDLSRLTDKLNLLKPFFVNALPALSFGSILLAAWANMLAFRRLLKRKGAPFVLFGDLSVWRTPEFLVWGVIAATAAVLMPIAGLRFLGINLLMGLIPVYFFQGMAITAFFINKKQLPRGMRIIIYGLILFQQLITFLVILTGFFDTWVNFRKIGIPPPPDDPER